MFRAEAKNREPFGHSRETQVRASGGAVRRDREKHSERVKKKKETFFFAQVTQKEDKLVDFSWSF